MTNNDDRERKALKTSYILNSPVKIENPVRAQGDVHYNRVVGRAVSVGLKTNL